MCAITFYAPMLFERAVKRNGAGFKRVGQGDNVGGVNRPEETGRTQLGQRESKREMLCSSHALRDTTQRPTAFVHAAHILWLTPPPPMLSRSAYDCPLYCLASDPRQHSTAAKLAQDSTHLFH
jgi:hypothetical protein